MSLAAGRIPMTPRSLSFFEYLESLVPFSLASDRDEIVSLLEGLRASLQLEGVPTVLPLDPRSAIALEEAVRLKWWSNGDEGLRAALHARGHLMYSRASATEARARLADAWGRADALAHSRRWRDQLLARVTAQGPDWAPYLRLFFRAAQQTMTRAARWEAIMGGRSHFQIMLELFARGAWPVGQHRDQIIAIVVGRDALGLAPHTPDLNVQQADARTVFLAADYRGLHRANALSERLARAGWSVISGRRDEAGAPMEHMLAEEIRRSVGVVALEDVIDADFGRSWWIHQEIQFAVACGKPILRLSPSAVDSDSSFEAVVSSVDQLERHMTAWRTDSTSR